MLLSLEDDAIEVRYALMNVARELYSSGLSNHSPVGKERIKRMMNPILGDYVLEIGRGSMDDADRYRAFGVLLSNVVAGGGDFVQVQYGPAGDDVCTWSNASFVAVPIDRPEWWLNPPGLGL